MSEPEAKLEDFVASFVAAFDDVAEARVALVERSLNEDGPARLAHQPRLGATSFAWRYRLVKTGQSLFLFFRRTKAATTVFDQRLRWRELPLPLPLPLPPDPSPAPPLRWEYRLRAPSFLGRPATSITAASLTDNASSPDPMRFPLPDGRELQVIPMASRNQVTWRLEVAADTGSPPVAAKAAPAWPLDLVTAWLSGLRAAQTDPEARTRTRSSPVPRWANTPENSLTARILASLVEAYEAAHTAGCRPRLPGGLAALGFTQTIEDFAGEIDLRLKPDGQSLADETDTDAILLRLSHRITRLGDTARLEVHMHPPDVLVDGELREQVLEVFAQTLETKKSLLGEPKDAGWAKRIRNQIGTALVLRSGQRENPLLLVALPADGTATAALLSARAAAPLPLPDNGRTPDFKLGALQPRVLRRPRHPGKRIGGRFQRTLGPTVKVELPELGDISDPGDDRLKPEAQALLLGLMHALHRWGGLMP